MSNYPDNAIGSDLDVAIVGLSARFPGASHIDEFLHNLVNGIESITPLSDEQIVISGVPLFVPEEPELRKGRASSPAARPLRRGLFWLFANGSQNHRSAAPDSVRQPMKPSRTPATTRIGIRDASACSREQP